MNYFQMSISEFKAATQHLSDAELRIYLHLIFHYYETETKMFSNDIEKVFKICGAKTKRKRALLLALLDEFFDFDGDGWTHRRCEKEIKKSIDLINKRIKAGKESARKRKETKTKTDQYIGESRTSYDSENNPGNHSTHVQHMFNTCATKEKGKVKDKDKNIRSKHLCATPTASNVSPKKTLNSYAVQKTTFKANQTIEGDFLPAEQTEILEPLKPVDQEKNILIEPAYHDLASWMAETIRYEFPRQKIDLIVWADCIRKLIKIDKKTEAEIRTLWIWIRNHNNGNFSWSANCRTPLKLRKRSDGLPYFDLIQNQMQRERQQFKTKQSADIFEYIIGDKRNDW